MSGFPRREFLRAGQSHLDTVSKPPVPGPPDARLIDTWLAIHADKSAMYGHLCCGTYRRIIKAIQRASKVMAGSAA